MYLSFSSGETCLVDLPSLRKKSSLKIKQGFVQMRQLNEKLIVGADSSRTVYIIRDNRSIKEFQLDESVGNIHDFFVTNAGNDSYDLTFFTSEGVFIATLMILMKGNNFTLGFDEQESLISITSMDNRLLQWLS